MAKLRAPAQHGELLLEPATRLSAPVGLSEAELNRSALWGRSLAEWRRAARSEVLALAGRYTGALLGTSSDSKSGHSSPSLCFIGGHQPELFHPGVWIKAAVVHELTQQSGGVGLNLTVDNDLCPGAAIAVPRGRDQSGMATIDWDELRPQAPWEERSRPDQALFGSFGFRCAEHLQAWGIEPLAAGQDWNGAAELSLVDRLVRLRGQFERRAGVSNLELRVSDLAETECFQQFVAELIQHAQEFSQLYNRTLQEYRLQHRVRSQSHPVPALSIDSRGIELPLWVWRAGEGRRRPLYVRAGGLHDGEREIGPLETARRNGWKIRPRALSLTLFCRLLLGSAFVHGIGGALYDQMTDSIIHELLGITPPVVVVATATLRLFESFAGPNPHPIIDGLQHDRRALRWNPDLLVLASATRENLNERLVLEQIARKHLIVDEINAAKRTTDRDERRTRHDDAVWRHVEIQRLNELLRMHLPGDLGESIAQQLAALQQQVPNWESLCSREFASNLFPASQIEELFRSVRGRISASV